jgi:uncharacterized protein
MGAGFKTFWTSQKLHPAAGRWAILVALSLALVALLEIAHLPAALLLGPMMAAIGMAATGGALRLPGPLFFGAQGVIGVMIASNLPLAVFGRMGHDWPIFTLGTVSTLVVANGLGWLLARTQALPGTTAIWGSAPGAATAMTLMSEGYGADMRLVAFMQYLRVACCAAVATIVAAAFGVARGTPHPIDWFAPVPFLPLAETLAIAIGGAWVAVKFKIPGGALLLPMALGIALKITGLATIALPPWLLAFSYAIAGWVIGMRFTSGVVRHAASVFPRVLAMILTLIAICGGVAGLLVVFAGVDPMTAYLATSPGGADSVAIISVSTKVDVPFVMSMQIARFLAVLVVGPLLARRLSAKR